MTHLEYYAAYETLRALPACPCGEPFGEAEFLDGTPCCLACEERGQEPRVWSPTQDAEQHIAALLNTDHRSLAEQFDCLCYGTAPTPPHPSVVLADAARAAETVILDPCKVWEVL